MEHEKQAGNEGEHSPQTRDDSGSGAGLFATKGRRQRVAAGDEQERGEELLDHDRAEKREGDGQAAEDDEEDSLEQSPAG